MATTAAMNGSCRCRSPGRTGDAPAHEHVPFCAGAVRLGRYRMLSCGCSQRYPFLVSGSRSCVAHRGFYGSVWVCRSSRCSWQRCIRSYVGRQMATLPLSDGMERHAPAIAFCITAPTGDPFPTSRPTTAKTLHSSWLSRSRSLAADPIFRPADLHPLQKRAFIFQLPCASAGTQCAPTPCPRFGPSFF